MDYALFTFDSLYKANEAAGEFAMEEFARVGARNPNAALVAVCTEFEKNAEKMIRNADERAAFTDRLDSQCGDRRETRSAFLNRFKDLNNQKDQLARKGLYNQDRMLEILEENYPHKVADMIADREPPELEELLVLTFDTRERTQKLVEKAKGNGMRSTQVARAAASILCDCLDALDHNHLYVMAYDQLVADVKAGRQDVDERLEHVTEARYFAPTALAACGTPLSPEYGTALYGPQNLQDAILGRLSATCNVSAVRYRKVMEKINPLFEKARDIGLVAYSKTGDADAVLKEIQQRRYQILKQARSRQTIQ
jgi:predicted lactoylglutathione lyase